MGFRRRFHPMCFHFTPFAHLPFYSPRTTRPMDRISSTPCIRLLRTWGHCTFTLRMSKKSIKGDHFAAHPQGKHLSSIVQPYALRAPEVLSLVLNGESCYRYLECLDALYLPFFSYTLHFTNAIPQDVRACNQRLAFLFFFPSSVQLILVRDLNIPAGSYNF